jgi:hypothetical protein
MKLNPDNFKSILKNLILEQIKEKPYLQEIFDSKPFKTQFDFHDNPDYYYVPPFNDPYGNVIKVYFYKLRNNCFEVDFMVNGSSYSNSNVDYSVKDYSILINTIYSCISQFLKEFSPQNVHIEGADSDEKEEMGKLGQKNSIYTYASIFLTLPDNYKLITKNETSGDFFITKRNK